MVFLLSVFSCFSHCTRWANIEEVALLASSEERVQHVVETGDEQTSLCGYVDATTSTRYDNKARLRFWSTSK